MEGPKRFVYILRSASNPGRWYTGLTSNVAERLVSHNAGRCTHTASGDPRLGLAGISSGACRLFLANPEYRQGHRNAGPVVIWLNLQSRNEVDDLHRRWTSTGARLFELLKGWATGSTPELGTMHHIEK